MSETPCISLLEERSTNALQIQRQEISSTAEHLPSPTTKVVMNYERKPDTGSSLLSTVEFQKKRPL